MVSRRRDPLKVYEVLFSSTPELTGIRQIVDQISVADIPVLIRGETGTGKDLLARIIHLKSSRRERPFIKVNCAAIPQALLESELFGFESGAFTGAIRGKPGKFELAGGGTIFLDEIGEMDLAVQSKILQILQDGEFSRLGGTQVLKTDARVITATNMDLEKKVRNDTFQGDLFYSLIAVHISIPPLRKRKEQLHALIDYFSSLYGQDKTRVSEKTRRDFERYDWPGNIRELESHIRRITRVNNENRVGSNGF